MSHGVQEVKYKGIATTRSISKAEWEAAGVIGQGPVTWDASNEFTVPGAKLVDGAIDVLRRENEFTFEMEQSKS